MNISTAMASIVTIENDVNGCLKTVSQPLTIDEDGLRQAQATIIKLKEILTPMMPAAGLAAPQIGINERVFIYSWDRSINNLQVVVNPTFEPLSQEQEASWEGCYSTILCKDSCQMAYVPRYTKIRAQFHDEQGQQHTFILEKFAARVFQHEYDHLEGWVNIFKPHVETKRFQSQDAMSAFYAPIKATIDASNYVEPVEREG